MARYFGVMVKSIATALAVVAMLGAAHAAELPGQKAKAPEKAQKCDIGGVAGVLLPGTQTCVKISGGVAVEAIGANRKTVNSSGFQ